MENSSEAIKNFEKILMKNSRKKRLLLYNTSTNTNKHNFEHQSFNPQTIISDVSLQLKAIQKADTVFNSNHFRKTIQRSKKSNLLPVNAFIEDNLVSQTSHGNKFETQFELDTQLMDIIVNAEELVNAKSVKTQEFDNTFMVIEKQRKSEFNDNKNPDSAPGLSSKIDGNENHNTNSKITENFNGKPENVENNYEFNENYEEGKVSDGVAKVDLVEDENIPSSYVFMPLKKSTTPSPLVFDLNTFEDFEKIAVPVIEENSDKKSAKQLINSQIVGRELLIQYDNKSSNCADDMLLSPVLNISVDKFKVTENEDVNKSLSTNQEQSIESEFMKDSVFLKDDIIFSSDEESEYIHQELQDLPLTCALETSFYDQPEILDKTMFVGFQTASNRSIQICADTYKKAKNFLDSFDDDRDNNVNKVTLTELVNICDKLHKNCDTSIRNNCNATEINENLDKNDTKTDNEEIYVASDKLHVNNVDTNPKNNYNELKKESFNDDNETIMSRTMKRKGDDFMVKNKKIKLLEMALTNYEQISQGIDLKDNINLGNVEVENTKQTSNVTENKINSSADANHIDEDIIDEFDVPLVENKNENNLDYHSFKTTNLEKDCINIIEKFEYEEPFNEILKGVKANCVNSLTIPNIVGFKTASNKNIEITKHALAKSRLILEDFNKIPLDINKPEFSQDKCLNLDHSSKVYGFKTASNKEIQVSVNALTKSRSIFQEIIENDDFNTGPEINSKQMAKYESSLNTYMGFRKANNKEIKISEEAYFKTKNMFENILINEEEFDKDFGESIKHKSNVLEAIQEGPTELKVLNTSQHEIDNDFNTELDSVSVFPKTTAVSKFFGNESVNVSAKAIIESKKIFADKGLGHDYNFLSKNKNSNKNFDNTKQYIAKSRRILEDFKERALDMDRPEISQNKCSNLDLESKVCGFKTASNKEIGISIDALSRSRAVFQDIIENGNDINTGPVKNPNEKFKYESCAKTKIKKANKEEIKISEEAYSKNKNQFEDIVINNKGFGKEPQKELKHEGNDVKVIQKDPELQELNKLQHEISNDFYTEFDSVSDFPNASAAAKFCGFKTASNKPVNVSEKAIMESKKVFADINLSTDSNFICKNKIANHSIQSKSVNNVYYEKETNIDTCKMLNDKVIMNRYLYKSNSECNVASYNDTKSTKKDLNQKEQLISDTNIDVIAGYENTKDTLNFTVKDVNLEIHQIKIDKPKFQPFQTASVKPVTISDKAMAESKALLVDIGNSKCSSIPTETHINLMQSSLKGFQTASKKPIKISDHALVKSIKLFKDIDNESNTVKLNDGQNRIVQGQINKSPPCNKPIFRGFQTSRGIPVEISAEALAKSKLLLEDFDNDLVETQQTEFRFQGFQTGNKNTVSVSNEALDKSKELFNDIRNLEKSTLKTTIESNIKFGGFQTANNKMILITEQALQRSCHVFQDINVDFSKGFDKQICNKANNNKESRECKIRETIHASKNILTESKNRFAEYKENCENTSQLLNSNKKSENLEDFIDTQVINNLEETLYTEDFCKNTTPKNAKRSGSPILSCPKAKKRKIFQTPYKTGFITNKKIAPFIETTNNPINKRDMLFNYDYKKTKRYTLKDLAEVEKSSQTPNTCVYSYEYKFETLLNFRFIGKRNDVTDCDLSVEDVKNLFKNAVNKKLIPDGWLDNHIKLVIWKLLSYEMVFPNTLSGVCSVKNLLNQLKYRYDKELYNAERPALRKILEKDDIPSKTLVLCVAAIYVDGVSVSSVANLTSNVELLLTDGWYCVKSTIDKLLEKLVYDEKITIGSKIVTNGAELLNCDQGIAPWEDTSSVRLKIFGNSTRPARWDARLGYHRNAAILTSLSTVKVEGGKVSKLRLYVTRVYPALFVEKFEDGSTVTRSERLETIYQLKYESERQTMMEKLYEEIEKELSDQDTQDSECSYNNNRKLYNGSQLMSSSQIRSLEERTNKRRDVIIQNIQTKLNEKMAKHGLNVNRNVITLLKVRVAAFGCDTTVFTKGLLSIWKPNDAILDIVKEGVWIEVFNVVPTAVRYSEIQISVGRQTIFLASKYKETEKVLPYTKSLKRKCYHVKDLAKNPTMTTDYNEIDTVGFIFEIEPSTLDFESSKQLFQNLYVTDSDKNIICVNFWGGLKKFGYQNVLDTGQVVTFVNLQRRSGNTKKSIPQYRVTEFSYFTKTPKNSEARNMVEDLSKKLSGLDKRKFCEECVSLRNNFSKQMYFNNENESPYRINNNHNLTKNKIFIDSPLQQKPSDNNFNLTGLDFESTFKQNTQEQSPQLLLRKKKVDQKIAKLKMYGEPPPLSSIHIINKSITAFNSYRSPLASNHIVASVKNCDENGSTEDASKQTSPILVMNRTYVKKGNPIKLNFSNVQDKTVEDEIDHFADDFDASPPLSLD